MAKGQKRSTREKKKPKATAKKADNGAVKASDARGVNIGGQRPGGKGR